MARSRAIARSTACQSSKFGLEFVAGKKARSCSFVLTGDATVSGNVQ